MSGSNNNDHTLTQQTLLWNLVEEIGDSLQTDNLANVQDTVVDTSLEAQSDAPIDTKDLLADRYKVQGILGKGGMGEVLRVFDTKFERSLAMKIIHSSLVSSPLILQLFIKEAKSTGLLQHPGTVPVHDFGTLSDGRLYFTMQEIQGITLKEAIQHAHEFGTPSDWGAVHKDWSIHRLLGAFERICETMAYAHDMGLMHRDIKPSNFMLGKHGEVLVMDWGIAKVLPHGESYFPNANTLRPNLGSVVGTPDYIAPEQARGESDQVNAKSDVFSLGCVLYEIIAGHSLRNTDVQDISELKHILNTDCPDLPVHDETLQDIYYRCVALDPIERYNSASELYQDLSAWLDGESKRQRALAWVAEAKQHHQQVVLLQREINQIETQIQYQKDQIQKWSPLADKQRLWDLEDTHARLQQEADLAEMNSIEGLHSALNHAPDLQEAHQVLARIYHTQHQRAELQLNQRQAHLTLELMRLHDRGEFSTYLSGQGTVLFQNLTSAEWRLFKLVDQHRRLQPIEMGIPQTSMTLDIGSYALQHTREPLTIPFTITRSHPTITVQIPSTPNLHDGECWIPSGNCWIGSITEPNHPYRNVAVDSFIIQQHPVTNRQYIQFLESLVQTKGLEHALQHVPRTNAISNKDAQILYTWNEDTERFTLEPDPQGDCWDPDWPVIMVSGKDAIAYANWWSEQTGVQWRLPTTIEWEKAARGVDGRNLPWGNYFEPTWSCVRGSTKGRTLPARVDDEIYPEDCSIYGVRGLAGNVQDFCIDPNDPENIVCKGGAWAHHPEFIHMAIERQFSLNIRLEVAGFRLVRSVST